MENPSCLSWFAKDPSLNKFYEIMHEYWGDQAGSQPDAPADSDGEDDVGDGDVVEMPAPVPADPPAAPPAKALMPPPPALMPPPPAPLQTMPTTVPTVPPPKGSEADLQARVAALRTLTLNYRNFLDPTAKKPYDR